MNLGLLDVWRTPTRMHSSVEKDNGLEFGLGSLVPVKADFHVNATPYETNFMSQIL